MILISTSSGWNYGDDVIREGVTRLLGIPLTHPTAWINRCEMNTSAGERKHQWQVQANFSIETAVSSATAIVEAGTPGWAQNLDPVYALAASRKIPVFVVGVSGGRRDAIRKVVGQVRAATARDPEALKFLRSVGLEAKQFLDPAIHAAWPTTETKNLVILNYRARGGNGRHSGEDDAVYRTIYARHRDIIDCVTVHEVTEVSFARKLFPDTPVVFCADYTGFKALYASCRLYIGGRIHGALSVVANGGQAHLMYRAPKKIVVEIVRDACREALGWSPVQTSAVTSDFKLDTPDIDGVALREFFQADFLQHKQLLLRNSAPWLTKKPLGE